MRILLLFFALFTFNTYAQVKILKPKHTCAIPKVNLEALDKLVYSNQNYYISIEDEKKLIDIVESDGVLGHFYGGGCSWYCGGMIDTITASSSLNEEFIATNIHDFRITTAWVEGSKDDGKGEYIVYSFPGNCPRITGISIHNGYVKDKKLWRKYGRVKKLLMYYNDEPYAILKLKDICDCQDFEVDTLGYKDKENAPNWTIKFEILEVYPGSKSQHTAITEVYFDGIDVH